MTKDVSIGELDVLTGFTYVTQQRGRLLFNMGVRNDSRRDGPLTLPAADMRTLDATATCAPPGLEPPRRPQVRRFRSGAHVGKTLYPEETYYLLQRGDIVVFEMEEIRIDDFPAALPPDDDSRRALSVEAFLGVVHTIGSISLCQIDTYVHLKESKLHPRRHICCDAAQSSANRDQQTCPIAFDVFKSVTQTVLVEEPCLAAPTTETCTDRHADPVSGDLVTEPRAKLKQAKKRKLKRQLLVFRVAAYHFRDVVPLPSMFRCVLGAHEGEVAVAPTKLAVVHDDGTVLMFEIDK
ncbi:hypothetical protein PINS_up003878 [Pythium insidiosum]|nr:hypothetical protein PINS_up003878 [Pythium insidiosum]